MLSVKEAALLLKCSDNYISKLIARGKLPGAVKKTIGYDIPLSDLKGMVGKVKARADRLDESGTLVEYHPQARVLIHFDKGQYDILEAYLKKSKNQITAEEFFQKKLNEFVSQLMLSKSIDI
jgi:hypothetical protein